MRFSSPLHLTTAALCLAALPALPQVTANAASDAMTAGIGGYNVYRIPGFIVAPDDSLLLFAEGRPNQSDPGAPGDIDLVYNRSTDGGQTWSPVTILHQRSGFDFSDPRPVVDESTGTVHMLYTQWPTLNGQAGVPVGLGDNSSVAFHMSSTDNGATWSSPTNINTQVKDPTWASLNTGPGLGIQLQWQDADPSRNGRMVVPAHHRPATYRGVMIYSDDGGATWSSGTGSTPNYMDESEVIELTNGDLLWNGRRAGSGRNQARSTDGGQTWVDAGSGDIPVSAVDTGMVRYSAKRAGDDRDRILYSAPLGSPAGAGNGRNNIGVWTSYDEGKTFTNPVLIESGSAAYSVIDRLSDGSIGLIYEVNHNTIRYVNFDLAELEGGDYSADMTHYDGFNNTIDTSKGGVGWSGGWRVDGGPGYNGGSAQVSFSSEEFDLGFTVSMDAGGGQTNTIDPGIVPNERANGIYGQVFTTEAQAGPLTEITVQRADTSTASPGSVYLHVYTDLDPTDGITPGTFLGSSLAPASLNPTDSGITAWSFDGVSTVLDPNTPYFFGFANSQVPGDITTSRAALLQYSGNEGAPEFASLRQAAGLQYDNGGAALMTADGHIELSGQTLDRDLATPIDLDAAGAAYASVLISRGSDTGPDDSSGERLALELLTSTGVGVGFGVNSDESFFIEGLGAPVSSAPDAFDPASTYMLVMKIASQGSGAGNADQLFLKVFETGETLPASDTGLAWDLVGDTTANLDLLLERVSVTAGANALWSVDELRLGETFDSVVEAGEERYTLTYDTATGDLTLDTLGGPIKNYVLGSEGGFIEENHVAFMGELGASVDFNLSETGIGFSGSGVFNLGAVMPTNLSPAELEAFLTSLTYVADFGEPILEFALVYDALAGDTDLDGDIDDTDLGLAISNFTGPVGAAGGKTAAQGDTDGDGDVDDTDIGVMISGFTGPLTPAAVPEPSTLGVFGLGLLGVLRRRRGGRVHAIA